MKMIAGPLEEARIRLGIIASRHIQGTGPAGTVSGFCVECDWAWPCPTYKVANGDAFNAWDFSDDEDLIVQEEGICLHEWSTIETLEWCDLCGEEREKEKN